MARFARGINVENEVKVDGKVKVITEVNVRVMTRFGDGVKVGAWLSSSKRVWW